MKRSRQGQLGFSLLELVVAMAITLVISGAIYGMMAAGQSSFEREPLLSERQQNIRLAMTLIQEDIANAGQGFPPLWQSFTNGLDGAGPATPRLLTQAGGAVAQTSDFLQIFGNDGRCPPVTVCKQAGANLFLHQSVASTCYGLPGLVNISDNTGLGELRCAKDDGKGSCGNAHLIFPGGGKVIDNAAAITPVNVVRYEIRLDATDLDINRNPIPSLWRSADADALLATGCGGGGAGWQLVARWIEDLQVQYRTNAGWVDNPPPAAAGAFILANYANVVREVRISLSARANLRGTNPGAGGVGGAALRGQLVTTTSPRSALAALAQEPVVKPAVTQWR